MLESLEDEDDYLNQPIDKHRVPPIHQKRLLAFVNHFIVDTVDFLNRLISDCDLKFVQFETKMRRVEDSLAILEAKLSSVPDLQGIKGTPETITPVVQVESSKEATDNKIPTTSIAPEIQSQQPETSDPVPIPNTPTPAIEEEITGVKASEDYRYRKFFKMVHFGVSPQAVKVKLSSEGLDPSVLDNPNRILSDGQRTPPESPESSQEDEDSS